MTGCGSNRGSGCGPSCLTVPQEMKFSSMKYKEYKISEIFTADETIVPDPSIIKQKKSKKNLDYYSFVTSL
jgi:hypothetical protein